MRLPILVYHRVTDAPLPQLRDYAVSPAAFRRQMRLLRLGGWKTVDPDDLLAARAGRAKLPARAVMITFDDAYAEIERKALPALRANRQKATIYACAGLLGASSDQLRGDDLHEGAELMDAEALRRVRAQGFGVESHTVTHPRLTGLDDTALAEELSGSRERLAELLGEEVRHLAYPYGDYDDRVVTAAESAGYATAMTTDHGPVREESPLRLPRIYVSWGDGCLRVLARLLRGVG